MNAQDTEAVLQRMLRICSSFLMAAVAAFALTVNVYIESFHAARLAAVLVCLMLLHLLVCPRLLFIREFALYSTFIGYLLLQLLWTDDIGLALNTLIPAVSCLIAMIFFGTLVVYYDLRAVLLGVLGGFLSGAVLYTVLQGFPFAYPAEFSYNAIASMYFFGLVVAILTSCYVRSRGLLPCVALVLFLLIVATTSIKTNLGVLLGVLAIGVIYFRYALKLLRRYMLAAVLLIVALGFVIARNDALVQTLQRGSGRVMLGFDVLQAREDLPGYSALESRNTWRAEGLSGFAENPLFGHGVEAFRARYDITSHATPIDLLYNSGLIGLVLFYGVLGSLVWRLYESRRSRFIASTVVIFGAIVSYSFISLSGIVHANAFLAAFVAIGTAVLQRDSHHGA